ncbi:MAG: XRE family transcriptional regulator [Gemmataceae bacterium]|nr:XRE family transcriptional regulator [Gemmataceae bacterium]
MVKAEEIDPRVLGQRIAEARKAKGLTQEEVAGFLGYSRPTYIAIEKGERPLTAEEIVQLAKHFGRSVHELVRPGEPVGALQPHLRAVAEKRKGTDERSLQAAMDELQQFAEDYLELERLLSAPLRTSFPSEIKLEGPVDVTALAEGAALQERRRLGLGDQPVIYLRSTLEWDVGLRIFYGATLPSAVAGMFAFSADVGCCILINRLHPAQRRRVSMVHEYGHLIVNRYTAGIDYLAGAGRKPANERFAESFALSFLMPASSVRAKFHETVTSTGNFRVADLCRLSHFFFVSVEAMSLRLEKLGLIPKGSYESLKESGLSPMKASQELGLSRHPETSEPYPERYKFLAVHAYQKGLITQMQLARFLRCQNDVVKAREIVTQCQSSAHVAADGRVKALRLEDLFAESLLSDAS